MYKYLKAHERDVLKALESPETDFEALGRDHLARIGFLQHERLIHLLVTLAIAFFALLTVLASATGGIPFHAVAALLLILLVFYVIHYYHLENGVQRWYALYERILEKMRNGGGSDG